MISRPRSKNYLIGQEIRYGTEKFSQKVYFMSMFKQRINVHEVYLNFVSFDFKSPEL